MFSNPEKNVAELNLREGMRVADFGTGAGFYIKSLSQKVGEEGKVYAIEVQKDFVKKLESEIKNWRISNVECIWGDIETIGGTKIRDNSIDAVIVSNVLFQAEDKLGLIDEAKRVLKPNGQILLIDWADSFGGMGPSFDQVIRKEDAIDLFNRRGFKLSKDLSVSDHHYGIIFKLEG